MPEHCRALNLQLTVVSSLLLQELLSVVHPHTWPLHHRYSFIQSHTSSCLLLPSARALLSCSTPYCTSHCIAREAHSSFKHPCYPDCPTDRQATRTHPLSCHVTLSLQCKNTCPAHTERASTHILSYDTLYTDMLLEK